MFFVTIAAIGCRQNNPTTELPKKLAEAKKAGLVLSVAELQQPLPRPEDNAAPIYVSLTQQLRSHPLSPQDMAGINAARDPAPSSKQLRAVRNVLARRSELLKLIHLAAARPACTFTRGWAINNANSVTLLEYATLRKAAYLIHCESIEMASHGKYLEACRNEALGFQIGRDAKSENLGISYLVGIYIDQTTLGGLRQIIFMSHGDLKVAMAVQQAIEQGWQPSSLAAAWKSEPAMGLELFDLMRRTGPGAIDKEYGIIGHAIVPQFGNLFQSDKPMWGRYIDSNEIVYLDLYMRVIAICDLPYLQAKPIAQQIDAEIAADNNPMLIAASMQMPGAVSLIDHRAQAEAAAQATRAWAAVLCYKGAHGALPTNLDQAITPVPMDPFNGKPLRYKREGAGFVVYSVGPDGAYDGGTPTVSPGNKQVAFRYPYPPYTSAK